MSLLDTIRNAVKVADDVTKPLQCIVQYQRALPSSTYGGGGYADPLPLHALVDWKQSQVRTPTGVLTVSRVKIDLLDVAEVIAATEGIGIGDDDLFTLPDGTTGPILDLSGFIDAGTGHPFATGVYLG